MPKKPARAPAAPPAPVKTREQLMDERAAADFAKMDAVNRKPIAPDLRDGPGGSMLGGGSSGFSFNGNLLTGRKPTSGIPDGVPGRTIGLLNRPRPK
jgi:hypothetical protein